jgi:hypothetical protein
LSSTPDPIEPRIAAAAAALCAGPVERITRAAGGGNSRVYRVEAGGRALALKSYPPRADDPRDRLGVECAALRFMAEHGVRGVPQVLGSDPVSRVGLFEWIDGVPVTQPRETDVDQATAFLLAVTALSAAPGATQLPSASEACWSGAEIVRQVVARRARLARIANDAPDLAEFLAARLTPALDEIVDWARAGYRDAGFDFERELEPGRRAVIPADFGFHNALRDADGRLTFIDFEYFGWDDPVKLAADFLLHPATALPEPLKHRIGSALSAGFAARDAAFPARLRLLYPLFAMRWCLIILNEFQPDFWARRVHAGSGGDWPAAKRRQLARAGELLDATAAGYRTFAYAG